MKKAFIIAGAIFTILLATAFGVYSFVREMNRPRLPLVGQVSQFSLTDQNNNAFSSLKLRGKVWIADFFFTTCADICPVMSKNMSKLSRTFEMVKGVKLVSISVNPEFDTPKRLKEYAAKYRGGSDNWVFLTGKREDIRDLALNSFKLGKIDEPVFHSAYFSLVDRNGFIRGYYDGREDDEISLLFKDAAGLLKERF